MQLRKLDKFGEKMENKMLSQDKLAKKAPLTMPDLAYPPPNSET